MATLGGMVNFFKINGKAWPGPKDSGTVGVSASDSFMRHIEGTCDGSRYRLGSSPKSSLQPRPQKKKSRPS